MMSYTALWREFELARIYGGGKDQDRRQPGEGEIPLPGQELGGIRPCAGQSRQPDDLV